MPEILDKCVDKLKKQGKSESSAFAICTASLKKSGKLDEKFISKLEKFSTMVELSHKDIPGLEDWEYLIHHIHKDPKTGKELIHHCPLVDHLGNLYSIDHVQAKNGSFKHFIVGLVGDQEVLWTDEEAEEIKESIPCANRQLK